MISSFLLLSLAFGGGGRGQEAEASALRTFAGWEKTPYSVHFTAADLHKYLNGGAAKYLAYGIEHLYVQEYQRVSDGLVTVAELYLLDAPQNAYGVYSCDSGGTHPRGLGMEASFEGGLLQFWYDRNYVRVYARDPSAEGFEAVLELGAALSDALVSLGEAEQKNARDARGGKAPDGKGSKDREDLLPQIVTLMPAQGLIEDSVCFFHSQISLNSIYYLSDENLLELSERTNAATAEYRTPSGSTARVVAVCYPAAKTAEKAYGAFCGLYLDRGQASGRGPEKDSEETKGNGREAERWARTGESEWLYAGVKGRSLALVFEASAEVNAVRLGRAVLESIAQCGREDQAGPRKND
jgi:hypothetical protein